MRKFFLFLYPIEEFFDTSFISAEFCRRHGYRDPISTLNECIQKRYREKGYEVVFAVYPDRNIKNVEVKSEDKIIFTDVTFEEASGYHKNGTVKHSNEVKYPNEKFLLDQLGEVESLVVGGFHAMDCVKRVADYSYDSEIDTLVDLELTDDFNYFSKQEHFAIDNYNPANIRESIRYRAYKDRRTQEEFDHYLDRVKDNFTPAYHLFDENYIPTETAEEMLTKEYSESMKSERVN